MSPARIMTSLSRPMQIAVAIGAAGSIASAIALGVAPARLGAAWLASAVFWIGVPVGALAYLAIDVLAPGPWSLTLRPVFRAALATLPVLALVFIPVLAGMPAIYRWSHGGATVPTIYLNAPFFVARTVIYFAVWMVLAWRLASAPSRAVAAIALILLLFTLSFAAIDWVMSLAAPWSSSIFGLLVSARWIVTALAGAILLTAALRIASPDALRTAGSMLLAGVLLIAYFAFMQFVIVWEENLPHEIDWYLERFSGPWLALFAAAIVIGLVAPFCFLLSRRVKRDAGLMRWPAGLFLVGELLLCWWLVLPAFPKAGLGWIDIAALAAIGGATAAAFLWRWERG